MNLPPQNKALPYKNKGKNKSESKDENKGENKEEQPRFKPPKKITAKYLHNAGLAYLQRFPASSMHFHTVMMRKINKSCRHHTEQDRGECEKLLLALIDNFKEMALLDDQGYLNGMIVSLRRRGLSSTQIHLKLRQKGYQQSEIKDALTTHDLDEYNTDHQGDFFAAITFARKKKLGAYDVLKKRDPDKSLAAMARAGYSYDISKKILDMTIDEIEEAIRHPSFH